MENSIEAYLADSREKVTLGTVVDCFKGKAVSSKVVPGDVGLINLSDMGTLGIQYHQLRTFQMDRRQLLRYLLEDGDVLIASKGTLKKSVFFISKIEMWWHHQISLSYALKTVKGLLYQVLFGLTYWSSALGRSGPWQRCDQSLNERIVGYSNSRYSFSETGLFD